MNEEQPTESLDTTSEQNSNVESSVSADASAGAGTSSNGNGSGNGNGHNGHDNGNGDAGTTDALEATGGAGSAAGLTNGVATAGDETSPAAEVTASQQGGREQDAGASADSGELVVRTSRDPNLSTMAPNASMEDLLRASEQQYRTLKHGDVIEGIIMKMDRDEILVDIGAKTEGIIPSRELQTLTEQEREALQPGDELLVSVVQPENAEGHAILSLDRARQERSWRDLQRKFEAGEIIQAQVTGHNKGGLLVNLEGVRGFVPSSQITGLMPGEANRQAELARYHNQTLPLKIIEINRGRNRLILSERQAMQEQRETMRTRLLQELQPGQIRPGTVASIADFGAFVDIGGADGLIHLSELSWKRVSHPSEVLKVGDRINVYVLSVDPQERKIALSLKRTQPEPWETITDNYQLGQIVHGTITQITSFGAFARLEDGIEGLIHVSELAEGRVAHPRNVVKEGDQLDLKVIRIDPARRRIGLSLKRVHEDEGQVPAQGVESDTEGGIPVPPDAYSEVQESISGPDTEPGVAGAYGEEDIRPESQVQATAESPNSQDAAQPTGPSPARTPTPAQPSTHAPRQEQHRQEQRGQGQQGRGQQARPEQGRGQRDQQHREGGQPRTEEQNEEPLGALAQALMNANITRQFGQGGGGGARQQGQGQPQGQQQTPSETEQAAASDSGVVGTGGGPEVQAAEAEQPQPQAQAAPETEVQAQAPQEAQAAEPQAEATESEPQAQAPEEQAQAQAPEEQVQAQAPDEQPQASSFATGEEDTLAATSSAGAPTETQDQPEAMMPSSEDIEQGNGNNGGESSFAEREVTTGESASDLTESGTEQSLGNVPEENVPATVEEVGGDTAEQSGSEGLPSTAS